MRILVAGIYTEPQGADINLESDPLTGFWTDMWGCESIDIMYDILGPYCPIGRNSRSPLSLSQWRDDSLCGSHTQHMSTYREMKELVSIQFNDRAAWDMEKYFLRLRDDQIIYLNPCEEMTVEMAMAISGGHRLVIADTIKKTIRVS